jgi:hypothetical protein
MSMCRDPPGVCEIETDDGQEFADANGHPLNDFQDYKENKPQVGERDMEKLWRIKWFGPKDGLPSSSLRSSSSSSPSSSSRSRSVSGHYIMRRVRCIPPGNHRRLRNHIMRRVSPEGSGTSRGTRAKTKAKAKADGSAKAKRENAAVFWRAEAAPGRVYNSHEMQKFAPPRATVAKYVQQGRWIGTYPDKPNISKSWTLLKSEKEAVKIVLRYLWDCHAFNAGKGHSQGSTMCPFPLIFKEPEIPAVPHVPPAESQPSSCSS